MTISGLEVIQFTVPRARFHNGVVTQADTTQTLTRISTDAGVEGYYFGGGGHGDQTGMDSATRQLVSHGLGDMLTGQDPFDRERLWHFMWTRNLPEPAISVVDNALWDLAGRAVGLPVCKLLGGCRDRVKAYASTYPNMGTPEEYAAHALACREQGYTHYKIHPYYARLVRADVLSLKERDFVTASRATGAGPVWIMRRHLFPNVVNTVVIIMTLEVALVILAEAALSFLTVGAPPGTPSWGVMISEGRDFMNVAWWPIWLPGLALLIISLTGNLMGDWLRDALDPRLRNVR